MLTAKEWWRRREVSKLMFALGLVDASTVLPLYVSLLSPLRSSVVPVPLSVQLAGLDDDTFARYFRFRSLHDMQLVFNALQIPAQLTHPERRYVFDGFELFAMLLRRFTFPNRLVELRDNMCGWDPAKLSSGLALLVDFLFEKYSSKVRC